jgi:serine/threonine protein kinase
MKKKSEISSLILSESSLDILMKLEHPNIGRILDIMEDEKQIYMIQDYYEGGDLFSFILKHKNIGENISKIIIRQLLEAVYYLHQNNIIHRDIKPQNIFVVKFDRKNIKDTLIKLCDFGSNCYFKDCLMSSDFPGTPEYTSPELISGDYTFKTDIWSIGVISYFLLSGKSIFKGKDFDVIFKVYLIFISFNIMIFIFNYQ